MYSAADYVEMLIITYRKRGNEENPHALFSIATILYKFVGWSFRESCGMSSIELVYMSSNFPL
jgi:hypothetical protein